ncbi:copper chaperone PCu(A)C [Acidocella aquatica]|nr:copper chaperone PCu(A)C [Acidocella aquatica]
MKTYLGSALLAALFLSMPAAALAGQDMVADHGAVWQTKKIGAATQGFIQIHNTGISGDVLTGWSCPVADTTTLVDAGGKPLQSLDIPAGQRVTLAPDGPHLVLQGTHFAIAMGSVLPCAFSFQNAGNIAVYLSSIPAPAGG